VLEKVEGPKSMGIDAISEVQVSGCTCSTPEEGCRQGAMELVTVGWSYVQLREPLAQELGFVAHHPIKLTAEPSRITVALHHDLTELEGIPPVACPP
jgi:hypothetical protein